MGEILVPQGFLVRIKGEATGKGLSTIWAEKASFTPFNSEGHWDSVKSRHWSKVTQLVKGTA